MGSDSSGLVATFCMVDVAFVNVAIKALMLSFLHGRWGVAMADWFVGSWSCVLALNNQMAKDEWLVPSLIRGRITT